MSQKVSQGVTKVSPRTLDESFTSGLARTTDLKFNAGIDLEMGEVIAEVWA